MKKAPNGEGSVYYENNTDRYVFAFTDLNGQRRRKRFKTRKEADKARRETFTSMDRGEYVEASAMTVMQWLDVWLKEYVQPNDRISTYLAYEGIIKKHLIPALGKRELQKLRAEHIQAWVNKLTEYKPSSVRRYYNVLRAALRQAADNGLIVRNPISAVKLPKLEKNNIKVLSEAEVQIFINSLPDNTHGHGLLFILGTGLRVSELCGLRWCDIRDGGINVNQIIYGANVDGKHKEIINAPKSEAGIRYIPLNDKLRALLDKQRQVQRVDRIKAGAAWQGGEPGKGNQYIFATAVGTPSDRSNISRTFRACLKQSGLESRGVHALRHTFASEGIHTVDIKTLSEILGHSDVATTLRTYVHSDIDTKRKAMEAMSKII